jgi:glycerophosphoryl diester phosphodiesterase
LINPAATAREVNLDAINLEIHHFPSGEAHQLHNEGYAVSLYIPTAETERLKVYGLDIEAQVAVWAREGLVDEILSDDVEQVVRIIQRACDYVESETHQVCS